MNRLVKSLRCSASYFGALHLVIAIIMPFGLGVHAGEVRFLTNAVEFSEGIGLVLVPIERTSTTAGERVTIQTADDSAVAGADYVAVNETYTFAEDETQISIAIRVLDNALFQSNRSFQLSLSDAIGVDLGSPSSVTLTIADNDDEGMAGRGAAGTTLLQGTFCVATNNDGSVLLGGAFETFNGEPSRNVVRLLADGNVDPDFDTGSGPNNNVVAMVVDADEQVVIGGEFTEVDGVNRNRIARIKSDGSLDADFDPGSGVDGLVESIDIVEDGRILIAGPFSTVNSVGRTDVALLSDTGVLDESFNVVTPQSFIGHVVKQAGDQILLGGEVDLEISDANVTNSLMRFSMTGVRDTDFQVSVGSIFFNRVSGIVLQPDGKIVIVGFFSSVNGVPSSCVARLNSDGTYDSSFNVGTGANNWIVRATLQDDGKILIGGYFVAFDGVPRSGVARLNADGSLDTAFDPGSGVNNACYSAQQLGDGTVLLNGEFTSFDGYDRFRFARLNGNGSLKRVPLAFGDVSFQSQTELKLKLTVEPGRDFRVIETDDFGLRTSILTNQTARQSVELTRPIDSQKKFYYAEQGY